MANNETIANGNMADDKIIQAPRLEIFDSLDDIKSYLGKNKQINYLNGNDWVIYSWHSFLNPVIIRNGVKIIRWIWRNFSIIRPRGFYGKSLDLHNYIRWQCGRNVSLFEAAGDHMDVLDNSGYEMFIKEAFEGELIWVPNEDFIGFKYERPIAFQKVPYFTSCFYFRLHFWVSKRPYKLDLSLALIFYYIYLHFEYGAHTAEQQIDMIKKVWGIYNEEQ